MSHSDHTQTRRDRLAYRRELRRRQAEALPLAALLCFAVGVFAGYGWRSLAYNDLNTKHDQQQRQVVTGIGY